MYYTDGSGAIGQAKSTGFDYNSALTKKSEEDEDKKKDFRDNPPVFSNPINPMIAMNNNFGTSEAGGYNA